MDGLWVLKAQNTGSVIPLKLDVLLMEDDRIVVAVGDMLRSVTLMEVTRNLQFKLLAYDFVTRWMSEVRLVDSGRLLCGDNLGNLFLLICARDTHFSSHLASDRWELKCPVHLHLGETVSRIAPRGGVLKLPAARTMGDGGSMEVDEILSDQHIVTTSNGSVKVVGFLSPENFAVLSALQAIMERWEDVWLESMRNAPTWSVYVHLSHSKWRLAETDLCSGAFKAHWGSSSVDADFIRLFLLISDHDQQRVCKDMKREFDVTISSRDLCDLINHILHAL